MTTLALLFTSPVVIKPINDIVRAAMPGIRVVNLLDDAILGDISRAGDVGAVERRVTLLARCAADAKADALLITCSSIAELAPPAAEASRLPVYTIDEAMAEEAVRLGSRIAVLATLATTLDPTCRLIERKAKAAGRIVTIRRELAGDAFEQLARGNGAAHDAILRNALESLAGSHDVIVLAQASMARLLDGRSAPLAVPVLSSPRLGIERVRSRFLDRGLAVG
ncbi:MAG TPA: aspartate/glutamate racemase family protein [Casimicrobiaceae bacterium]|nr:aspartate/glutamate racemase family protein [Casimicrobiaceae bacterium]